VYDALVIGINQVAGQPVPQFCGILGRTDDGNALGEKKGERLESGI